MFKVISARHVTARQREMIKWMIENDSLTCATRTMRAAMEKIADKTFKVTFHKNETDDWGRKVVRNSFAEIEIL